MAGKGVRVCTSSSMGCLTVSFGDKGIMGLVSNSPLVSCDKMRPILFFLCDTARDKFFVERALSNRKSSLLNLARAHDTGSFRGRVVWNTVQKRACTTADNVTAWKTPSNGFTEVDHKSECLYLGLDIEGGKRAETYAREKRCT